MKHLNTLQKTGAVLAFSAMAFGGHTPAANADPVNKTVVANTAKAGTANEKVNTAFKKAVKRVRQLGKSATEQAMGDVKKEVKNDRSRFVRMINGHDVLLTVEDLQEQEQSVIISLDGDTGIAKITESTNPDVVSAMPKNSDTTTWTIDMSAINEKVDEHKKINLGDVEAALEDGQLQAVETVTDKYEQKAYKSVILDGGETLFIHGQMDTANSMDQATTTQLVGFAKDLKSVIGVFEYDA